MDNEINNKKYFNKIVYGIAWLLITSLVVFIFRFSMHSGILRKIWF